MDLKNDSGDGDDLAGSDKVSDDMLLYLAKHYLKDQDCLSLALSGSSYNFPSLYASNRKRLDISRCFFLTPATWTRFFKGYISPELIIIFDASHTYWLPAEVLVQSTVQMTSLEELLVDDTKISLSHFPKIFEACQKVVKLSFTLNGKSLKEDLVGKASLDLLKKGFAKLVYLKMFNFTTDEEAVSRYETMNVEHPYESWLRILQVLKWCRVCTDLVINLAYPALYEERSGVSQEDEEMLDRIEGEMFPLLGWMKDLKSLVILRRCGYNSVNKGIHFFKRLFEWLLPQLLSLERLWVSEDYNDFSSSPPFLKSLISGKSPHLMGLKDERFASLEHVAEVLFKDLGLHPNLKYVQGYCGVDFEQDEALNDFCRAHQNLEQLQFDFYNIFIERFGDGDWSLPMLKILAFCCCRPTKKIFQQVIKGCPNIEELHIDLKLYYKEPMAIEYFSEFRFKHLKRLSIKWSERDMIPSHGFYLPLIFKQCPKLESIQLNGGCMRKSFFHQLILCLPEATNLRDLRLEWDLCSFDDYDFSPLLLFMEALLNSSNSPYFGRLVLKVCKKPDFQLDSVNCAEFEKFVVPFAKGMTHLIALGLIGFPLDPSAAEVIRRQLTEEIVPHRKAFWFHLGDELPKENDTSVPRIHYDEIVAPIDHFYAPPKF